MEEFRLSRRRVLGGALAGLAVAAVPGARAQQASAMSQSGSSMATMDSFAASLARPWGQEPANVSQPVSTLAIVEKNAGKLSFYSLPEGRRMQSIDLPAQSHEVVRDASGRYAYIGQYGVAKWKGPGVGGNVVSVVDLAQKRVVRQIDLTPYHRLHGVRMDAHGRLFVLSETSSMMIRIDRPDRHDFPTRVTPVMGGRSHYFVLRRDGSRAYISDTLTGLVIMIDPNDATVEPVKRNAGVGPEGCCLSHDERTFFAIDRPNGVIHAFDSDTMEPIRSRSMRGEAVRVVPLADNTLLVSNEADRSVSRLDADSLEELARLDLGAGAPALNVTPDARTLYASLNDDGVAVVDLDRWEVASRFETLSGPDSGIFLA